MYPDRVVSGMRPTGALHLGYYHGARARRIAFAVVDGDPARLARAGADLQGPAGKAQRPRFDRLRFPPAIRLLQAADVLIYRASRVPVGDDQVPHTADDA